MRNTNNEIKKVMAKGPKKDLKTSLSTMRIGYQFITKSITKILAKV